MNPLEDSEPTAKELLILAVQAIKFHNMEEVLPVEVLGWYDQRHVEQEVIDALDKNQATVFLEEAVRKLKP